MECLLFHGPLGGEPGHGLLSLHLSVSKGHNHNVSQAVFSSRDLSRWEAASKIIQSVVRINLLMVVEKTVSASSWLSSRGCCWSLEPVHSLLVI